MIDLKNIADMNVNKVSRPIKVLQFGEGNFLRAFADYDEYMSLARHDTLWCKF